MAEWIMREAPEIRADGAVTGYRLERVRELIRCERCGLAKPCENQELAKNHVWCSVFDFPVEKDFFCAGGK